MPTRRPGKSMAVVRYFFQSAFASPLQLFSPFLDAHRALDLLEEYHASLTADDDTPLRSAIERVIRIFRGRLFQALLGKGW